MREIGFRLPSRVVQALLKFYESSKHLDTAWTLKICIYVTWVMHLAVTGFLLYFFVFGTNSAYGIRARYRLPRRVAMIVHGLSVAIFFRGIFALAKSKHSRINQPGYFSYFFHYFGSNAHTSNISGILSTRLVALALLSFFLILLHSYKSRFSPFLVSFVHFAALLALFHKLCGFK